MKNLKFLAMLTPLLFVAACSTGSSPEESETPFGPSEEGREYIIEVCSPIYNFDWDQTSIDSLAPYKNDFNEIKNNAVAFDDSTRNVISALASQASQLTDARDQWFRDRPSDVINNLEEVEAVTNKLFDTVSAIGEEINKICAPFFE